MSIYEKPLTVEQSLQLQQLNMKLPDPKLFYLRVANGEYLLLSKEDFSRTPSMTTALSNIKSIPTFTYGEFNEWCINNRITSMIYWTHDSLITAYFIWSGRQYSCEKDSFESIEEAIDAVVSQIIKNLLTWEELGGEFDAEYWKYINQWILMTLDIDRETTRTLASKLLASIEGNVAGHINFAIKSNLFDPKVAALLKEIMDGKKDDKTEERDSLEMNINATETQVEEESGLKIVTSNSEKEEETIEEPITVGLDDPEFAEIFSEEERRAIMKGENNKEVNLLFEEFPEL